MADLFKLLVLKLNPHICMQIDQALNAQVI